MAHVFGADGLASAFVHLETVDCGLGPVVGVRAVCLVRSIFACMVRTTALCEKE